MKSKINSPLSDWRIKINKQKCKQLTFTLNRQSWPPLTLNRKQLPQTNDVTYLGVYLNVHLKLRASSLPWIINFRSPLCLDLQVLLYHSTLQPIWTYCSQLWGSASNGNIDIKRSLSIILRTITGAPWYVRNENIHRDLGTPPVKDEIIKQKAAYHKKHTLHQNNLAWNLTRVSNRTRLPRNYQLQTPSYQICVILPRTQFESGERYNLCIGMYYNEVYDRP